MDSFTIFNLLLQDTDPRLPYYIRETKKGVFWGQRKLLISEIFFLSYFYLGRNWSIKPIVVYAGAAGGKHINLLKVLFPDLEFELYDPRKFDVAPDVRTRIHQEFFTDFTAHYWSKQNRPILFICDIRTADWQRNVTAEETEEQIIGDMRDQERWHIIINPVASFMKFRLPWSNKNQNLELPYLDGTILKQAWARLSSTETRIIPSDWHINKINRRIWDGLKYEEQLFYHNSVVREDLIWPSGNINPPELNGTYDATAEVFIIKYYLTKIGETVTNEKITEISNWISKQLGGTIQMHYQIRK